MSSQCWPDWYAPGRQCPHGRVIALPSSGFTWPNSGVTWVTYIAALYSAVPFFLAGGSIALALALRGVREMLVVAFWLQTALIVFVAKALVGQKRPEGSCQVSCGMPSGHTLVSIGFLVWAAIEVGRAPHSTRLRRVSSLTLLVVVFLPVGWSRTLLKDHSWAQVIVGAVVGIIWGSVWAKLLQTNIAKNVLRDLCEKTKIIQMNYLTAAASRGEDDGPLSGTSAPSYGAAA